MQYNFESKVERGFCLTLVHFSGEGKQQRWARRMERFYGTLAKTAQAYATQCLREDPHSCYVCRMDVAPGKEPEQDGCLVTVVLSHRRPGMGSRRKQLCHRWQKGLLVGE